MKLFDIIKSVLKYKNEIDVKSLPSQGLFYKDDFRIFIEKAEKEDIIKYEQEFIEDNIGVIIGNIKSIVNKSTSFSDNYSFNDIKSIDIVFIFLEIVKLTTGNPIHISYFDEVKNKDCIIEFSSKNFNYYRINDIEYDSNNKEFIINDFKFSLPSIGVENCVTEFLIEKISDKVYNDYDYNFIFFLGNKSVLKFSEIENLVQLFNNDLDAKDLSTIDKIVDKFQPIQKYTLLKDDNVIEISSKIDLKKIWKS